MHDAPTAIPGPEPGRRRQTAGLAARIESPGGRDPLLPKLPSSYLPRAPPKICFTFLQLPDESDAFRARHPRPPANVGGWRLPDARCLATSQACGPGAEGPLEYEAGPGHIPVLCKEHSRALGSRLGPRLRPSNSSRSGSRSSSRCLRRAGFGPGRGLRSGIGSGRRCGSDRRGVSGAGTGLQPAATGTALPLLFRAHLESAIRCRSRSFITCAQSGRPSGPCHAQGQGWP